MKDEILLIHGYPDCARMWDKQVAFLSSNGYRCINLTLPNYGKEENRGSWGYSFPEISDMLAEVVEKHSK
jgi:pimeloyl-ACP methyl ester carboxylesterase